MINKALRIMIADPQHFQRLRLERDFNRQGYFAVAPAASLKEMLALLEYGDRVFDLVLINASLGTPPHFDLSAFCLDHPCMRQAFIYDVPERCLVNLGSVVRRDIMFSHMSLPEGMPIQRLLSKVDPVGAQGTSNIL